MREKRPTATRQYRHANRSRRRAATRKARSSSSRVSHMLTTRPQARPHCTECIGHSIQLLFVPGESGQEPAIYELKISQFQIGPLSDLRRCGPCNLRCRLRASPATGLVGMQENAFLNDYFECLGFLPLASARWAAQPSAVPCTTYLELDQVYPLVAVVYDDLVEEHISAWQRCTAAAGSTARPDGLVQRQDRHTK